MSLIAGQHGKACPRLDASLLQCTRRSARWHRRRAAEQRDELASSHSITSSAGSVTHGTARKGLRGVAPLPDSSVFVALIRQQLGGGPAMTFGIGSIDAFYGNCERAGLRSLDPAVSFQIPKVKFQMLSRTA
jgi:hypothetical protein